MIILNALCSLKGIKSQWVTDPSIAQKVLLNSNFKGEIVEQTFAMKAWAPVLSLESVEGEQWARMKKSFLELLKHCPPKNDLSRITQELVQERIQQGKTIDAPALAILVLSCLTKWLFDEDFKPEWEFIGEATWQWRREIALKGPADPALKQKVVKWMQERILNSKYYEIFGDKWMEPEYYSLFLQPFIISPAINVTDIAVALQSTLPVKNMNEWILKAIHEQHPFPILERWLPDGLCENGKWIIAPQTQVFIPLDKMGTLHPFESSKTQWMAFGAGGRACPGKLYAMALMVPLFTQLQDYESFYPLLNHKYSGRNNDGDEGFSETMYQIRLLIDVFCQSLLQTKRQQINLKC